MHEGEPSFLFPTKSRSCLSEKHQFFFCGVAVSQHLTSFGQICQSSLGKRIKISPLNQFDSKPNCPQRGREITQFPCKYLFSGHSKTQNTRKWFPDICLRALSLYFPSLQFLLWEKPWALWLTENPFNKSVSLKSSGWWHECQPSEGKAWICLLNLCLSPTWKSAPWLWDLSECLTILNIFVSTGVKWMHCV